MSMIEHVWAKPSDINLVDMTCGEIMLSSDLSSLISGSLLLLNSL